MKRERPILSKETLEVIYNLGVDSHELITWHLLDLIERRERDGIFVKEFNGVYGTVKILILLIDNEVIETVICEPDELDDFMEHLRCVQESKIAFKRDFRVIRRNGECDKCMKEEFNELMGDDDYE